MNRGIGKGSNDSVVWTERSRRVPLVSYVTNSAKPGLSCGRHRSQAFERRQETQPELMYYAALHDYMLALVAQRRSEEASCSKPNPRRHFHVFDSARSKSDCYRAVSPASVCPPPLCDCSFGLFCSTPSSLWTILKGGPNPASSIRLSRSKCPHRSLRRIEYSTYKRLSIPRSLAFWIKPMSFSAGRTKNQTLRPFQKCASSIGAVV